MILVTERGIQKRNIRCASWYLLTGLTCASIAVLLIVFDLQELVLTERMRVRPGLPPYEKWRKPSADIDLGIKIYIFSIQNPHEFLSNKAAKLKLKEIGPVVYKKVLHQKDIVFHDENSTMSFSTVFEMVLDEERTGPGILNRTITTVNPTILGLAAMAHDVLIARMLFNLVAEHDHVFINRTVHEILWNNTTPTFNIVKRIPFAFPRDNVGILFNAFYPSENRFNVNIGRKHGHKEFFKINTFNGIPRIGVHKKNFPKHCPFSLKGATEGSGLPPSIGKDDVIYAFADLLCRTYPMVYNRTMSVAGIEAYQYIYSDEIFTRHGDPDLDCLKQTGSVLLPNGLSDASKCAFGLPIAVSNPHFWGYHGEWTQYLEGLRPNTENHSSYIMVEPKSGIQLKGLARLQSNLILPRFDYFSKDIRRFSEMILPQFWMEYFMTNEDPIVHAMIHAYLSLPVVQNVLTILVLGLSVFLIYKSIKLGILVYQRNKFCEEKGITFEQQQLCPEK